MNPAATLVSTYTRWDGRIPYTPIAGDLTSVTGSTRDTTLDDSLKGEYLDEYTAGVDLGFWRDTSIRINVVRKRDYRGNKELNLAQPYELETTFSKSYSNGWSLLGSYSIDRRDARNIDPRNPNEALYGIGTTGVWALPETYQGVRLSGTYELPGRCWWHRRSPRSRGSTSIAAYRFGTL